MTPDEPLFSNAQKVANPPAFVKPSSLERGGETRTASRAPAVWRIERRLDARLRSDARALVITQSRSRTTRAAARIALAFFFLLAAERSRDARARGAKDVSRPPGLEVWRRFTSPCVSETETGFFCFETDIFTFHRDCSEVRSVHRETSRSSPTDFIVSSVDPARARAENPHSCRARVHTETTMAFSIAASPRLGLERSLRQADGRKVARCVFRGPALAPHPSTGNPMPRVTNTASLQITIRQTGRSACVVRASAEESKLWLPKSEVK